MDVVLPRPAAQGERDRRAGAHREPARAIVDLSGDFRLRDAAVYEKYYGAHAPVRRSSSATFVYGLPELNREAIRKARATSRRPGCFATTIELGALAARAARGCSTGAVEIVGITGSSGAASCRRPARTTRYARGEPAHVQAARAPAHPGDHRDARVARARRRLRSASCRCARRCRAASSRPASRTSPRASTQGRDRRRSSREPYAGEPFVRVPGEAPARGRRGQRLELRRGRLRLGPVTAGEAARRHRASRRIDNLIKGGAGQAIQSMNLMLGLDERPRSRTRAVAVAAARTVVVKLGGEVVGDRATSPSSPRDVAALAARGARVVVVHGGGPQATELQEALGRRRASSAAAASPTSATLDVMKMVVAGKVNVDLCAALLRAGRAPGRPARRERARHRGATAAADGRHRRRARPDRPRPRRRRRRRQRRAPRAARRRTATCPVLACLGADADGRRLQHQRRHRRQPASRSRSAPTRSSSSPTCPACCATSTIRRRASPRSPSREGRRAIADGVVTGGMIPKLEESFAAIAEGVRAVHVVGRLARGDLLRAVVTPGSVGTVVVADSA